MAEGSAMDHIYSYAVNFVLEQNIIAQIEVAQEEQSSILNLSCYSVKIIPPTVFELTALKKLYLDENFICILPETIANLGNLQVLTVDHNRLSDLPTSLHQLVKLLHLNLSYNPLKKVPDEVSKLVSLESLWLNHTDLSELPTSLESLENLDTLGARGNNLQMYPQELCKFTHLKWLTLDRNKLKQLPTEFQNLVFLKHLNLSNNLFDEVPPCLVHIKALQFCLMKHNHISSISDVILDKLKHLKLLDLRLNPVSTKVNRKMYPYVVLENGQTRNTEFESTDSEDYEDSIASEEINYSSGNSSAELEEDVDASLPKNSKFAFSGM